MGMNFKDILRFIEENKKKYLKEELSKGSE